MPFFRVLVWVIALFLLTSCSPDSDSREARQSLFKSVNVSPVFLGDKDKAPLEDIKKTVRSMDELYDVAVVQRDQEVLVAYKVKHMQRLRMKSIEANLHKRLKEKYPDYRFIVSADMKIFLEAVELIVHVDKENYPREKARKWFGSIKSLAKEQT